MTGVRFALVREDPALEQGLLGPGARRALLVASGGCTALALSQARPEVDLVCIDPNPAQLALVREKLDVLRKHPPSSTERLAAFGVGRDDPQSLCGMGDFEALFRAFRGFLDALGPDALVRRRVLLEGEDPRLVTLDPYWPRAFEACFADPVLETMFGPAATQHAPKGSYPAYFQRAIEGGLSRPDRHHNPWLHQVLLGHFVPEALPPWLVSPAPARDPELVQASLLEAPPLRDFDLLSLSNVFDWTDQAGIEAVARRLVAECKVGATVLVRQLNNRAPIEALLGDSFRFDRERARALLDQDRSLFYSRLVVGVKR